MQARHARHARQARKAKAAKVSRNAVLELDARQARRTGKLGSTLQHNPALLPFSSRENREERMNKKQSTKEKLGKRERRVKRKRAQREERDEREERHTFPTMFLRIGALGHPFWTHVDTFWKYRGAPLTSAGANGNSVRSKVCLLTRLSGTFCRQVLPKRAPEIPTITKRASKRLP